MAIESRPVRACAEAPGSVRESTSLRSNRSSDDSRFFHLTNPVKSFWHVESVTSSPEGSGINKIYFIRSEFCGVGFECSTRVPPGEKYAACWWKECGPASKPASMLWWKMLVDEMMVTPSLAMRKKEMMVSKLQERKV